MEENNNSYLKFVELRIQAQSLFFNQTTDVGIVQGTLQQIRDGNKAPDNQEKESLLTLEVSEENFEEERFKMDAVTITQTVTSTSVRPSTSTNVITSTSIKPSSTSSLSSSSVKLSTTSRSSSISTINTSNTSRVNSTSSTSSTNRISSTNIGSSVTPSPSRSSSVIFTSSSTSRSGSSSGSSGVGSSVVGSSGVGVSTSRSSLSVSSISSSRIQSSSIFSSSSIVNTGSSYTRTSIATTSSSTVSSEPTPVPPEVPMETYPTEIDMDLLIFCLNNQEQDSCANLFRIIHFFFSARLTQDPELMDYLLSLGVDVPETDIYTSTSTSTTSVSVIECLVEGDGAATINIIFFDIDAACVLKSWF